MRTSAALLLAALVLAASACGEEELAQPSGTGLGDTTTAQRPSSFSETRAAILAAADSDDYAALRPLIEPETFLSDFGFGEESDPVGRWEEMGSRPLETMGALLRMKHVVRETNEGTLYQWPRLDPDSSADDMTSQERELFLSFMSEEELDEAFNPDYGYTAPRLGILSDGTWWFFVADPGP
jgi:hypothetical protein